MLAYFFLFFMTLPGIFIDPRLESAYGRLGWIAIVTTCIFFVGFRYRVGCDWQNYADLFDAIRTQSDFSYRSILAMRIAEWGPAYFALNWLSEKLHLGMYFVNLVSAALTIGGLAAFCRTLPLPWLGWTIAFPYFIVVVSMGYTGQAVAIGLFFWALCLLQSRKTLAYFSIVLFAATFHISALTLLPLGFIPYFQDQPRKYISIFILSIVVVGIIIGPRAIQKIYEYRNAAQVSEGAIIRSLMSTIPAALFVFYRKDWVRLSNNLNLWLILALASMIAFATVWVMSTVVDRIGLYIIPLQVFVWSSIPVLPRFKRYSNLLTGAIVSYSAAILWVWLTFGANSRCWIPYQNIFLKSGII